MRLIDIPVPHLTTANTGPLHQVEKTILDQVEAIESWFRLRWQETPAPITSSVDLRHAGYKLAPVDTNLFPAGFNNLNLDFMPLCVQAAQSTLVDSYPTCKKILILPESHTRNVFYLQSLEVLSAIFSQAGFSVRIGSLDPDFTTAKTLKISDNGSVLIEPIVRQGDRIGLKDFDPCLILLNNDLSTGIPNSLQGLHQRISPPIELGWSSRLKSNHFKYYAQVAQSFADLIQIDPWLINPLFSAVDGIDFMEKTGIEVLAAEVNVLLEKICEQYRIHQILETPFVAVKADNGTYGMSVMMVRDGAELLQLNRKQRTRMAASKGSQKVTRVMIQEGVYSSETMDNGAVAEPVVYMIGPYVVGGFYRVHQNRGKDDNLNAPGMHFERLAFANACNLPCKHLNPMDSLNRFYAYGVMARLAALAAAHEIAALGER